MNEIDGRTGRVAECPNRIEATVFVGGRLYLFILLHDRSDARAVFDAFAATIDLTPETAVDYPGLTTTFVSPTNGFSFGCIDRGGLAPATSLWDPVNDTQADDGFDAVETGMGAYFMAASTPIPDGVSIDGWVDEYVSPGGWLQHPGRCGGPRRQQAEIIIDGQPGRISECANRIEATGVAGGRLYMFQLLNGRPDARAFVRRLDRHDRPSSPRCRRAVEHAVVVIDRHASGAGPLTDSAVSGSAGARARRRHSACCRQRDDQDQRGRHPDTRVERAPRDPAIP